jgi:CheY-like chemotaxis protein
VSETPTAGLVLLVEDDHDLRVSMRSLLEDEGYRVLTVTNGRSALELLAATEPKPGLILVDLKLPIMSGLELIERAQRTPDLAQIPIVAMSASRERERPAGTVGFLGKPVNGDDLVRVVAQHCRVEARSAARTGERPSIGANDDAPAPAGEPWRNVEPRGNETIRWEHLAGRWVAITVGSGGQMGKVIVTDSSGRAQVLESYEQALHLARLWLNRP